jgi:hypothetical protein
MAAPAPTSGPTSARVRFEVFTDEGRAFLRPGEDPIVLLPSPDRQEKAPLRDAWLYLFTWRLSKTPKGRQPSQGTARHPKEVPTLAFEIYADPEGRYHSPQRLDGPGQPHVTLALDDATASHAATDVYYGCWISPFRVPKKRLPACAATGQATDPEAMWKWLGDRGVLSNAFRWDELSRDSNQRGSCYAAVARSPLRRALQLTDDAIQEGAKNLKRFARTEGHDATELRYLHTSVTHILDSRPEMGFASRLDMDAFGKTKAAIKKQDKQLEGIHAALQAVNLYTDETAWQELLKDMKAAGPLAFDVMAQPLAAIGGVLGASPKTLPGAVEFFDKHPEVLDPTSYSDPFKAGRRGFKMIVALLKTAADVGLAKDAAHAEVKAGKTVFLPDGPYMRVQNAIAKWAKLTLGMEILKDGESGSFKALEAAKKGVDLPSVLWLSVLVDTMNAWRSLRDAAKSSDGWQRARAWGGFGSSMMSVGRSVGALVELKLNKAAAGKTIDHVKAVLMDSTEAYEDGLKKTAGAKAARVKLLRNVMGVVGSSVDMVLSGWKAWDEYQVDDFNAAFALGISALGSALSTVGYGIAFGNPAIGAILIAAGEVLMLIGTIAYTFCKNSELETWLEHCLWGNSRNSSASGSTKWSQGPLSKFSSDLNKQIVALDRLLFPIELVWIAPPTETQLFGHNDLCYLEVHCPMLSADSVLILGISGETRPGTWKVLRPFGPAQVSQGSSIAVRAPGCRRLVAHCKIDLYGDSQHVLPHDGYRSADISTTPSLLYATPSEVV